MATQTLRLQNSVKPDCRVFELPRPAAEHSAVVRMLLKDLGEEKGTFDAIIPIKIDVSDECLAKVFEWATHWANEPKPSDDDKPDITKGTPVEFSPWDEEFFSTVDQDMLYEILLATNYLEIKGLYDLACQTVVNMIRGKNTEEIRQILNLKSDFTKEEEEAVRRETAWAYDRDDKA
jgi:S-phase kinase-associated protein 1